MNSAKREVASLLERLPDDCTVEDVQYHLYVLEKIFHGAERAQREGTIPHDDAVRRLKKMSVH